MEGFIIKSGGRFLEKSSSLEVFVFTPKEAKAKIFTSYEEMLTYFVEVARMNPKAVFSEVTLVYKESKLKRRKDFDMLRRFCPDNKLVKDYASNNGLNYLLDIGEIIDRI